MPDSDATAATVTSPPAGGQLAEDGTYTLNEVAEYLQVHYMTVYRYVRTGRLAATKAKGEWIVRSADLSDFETPAAPRRTETESVGRTGRRRNLENRLLAADESGAWTIVENALASGMTPVDVHHHVMIPALQSIGRRWALGEITVQQEHRATAAATRLVARLGPLLRTRGRTRGTVVIGAPSSDHHSLGPAILADLLRSIRLSVVDLGGHCPPESFTEAMEAADRLVAVAISASTPDNEVNIRSSIAAIKAFEPSIPVFLGGPAIRDREHAIGLGADDFADRSMGVLERFELLVAPTA